MQENINDHFLHKLKLYIPSNKRRNVINTDAMVMPDVLYLQCRVSPLACEGGARCLPQTLARARFVS